jgi:hypothetical protein
MCVDPKLHITGIDCVMLGTRNWNKERKYPEDEDDEANDE